MQEENVMEERIQRLWERAQNHERKRARADDSASISQVGNIAIVRERVNERGKRERAR